MTARAGWIEVYRAVFGNRPLLLATVALLGLRAAMEVVAPLPIKIVFDSVLGHHRAPGPLASQSPAALLLLMALAMAAASAIGMLAGYHSSHLLARFSQDTTLRLRRRLLAKILSLPVADLESWSAGDLLTRLDGDANKVGDGLVQSSAQAAIAVITMAGILTVVAILMPALALIVVLAIGVFGLTVFRVTLVIRTLTRTARRHDGRALALALETIKHFRQVLALRQEGRTRRRYRTHVTAARRANQAAQLRAMVLGPAATTYGTLLAALALYAGGVAVLHHRMTLGDLVLLLSYLRALIAPSRTVARMAGKISTAAAAVDRIGDLLSLPTPPRTGGTAPPSFSPRIEMDRVSFTYSGQTEPVLQDIDLTVEPGERIAIVGQSGVGKSTLISLLLGFYEPTRGTVRIADTDVGHWDKRRLRWHVAWVHQQPELFAGPVWENITRGHPQATRTDAVIMVERLGLDALLSKLPDGYDTTVREGGTNLSGGQRQAIALARAMVRNATLLLLDEPVTGLDPDSQSAILNALSAIVPGRTTVIITHHPAPLSLAQRVYRLSDGRLALHDARRAADSFWAMGRG